jgi:Tfp pilus assembly protein FimT
MNTPLMIAIYALLALIAVPATRELLRTARKNAKRARLIPIRIDERKNRQSRDSSDR